MLTTTITTTATSHQLVKKEITSVPTKIFFICVVNTILEIWNALVRKTCEADVVNICKSNSICTEKKYRLRATYRPNTEISQKRNDKETLIPAKNCSTVPNFAASQFALS